MVVTKSIKTQNTHNSLVLKAPRLLILGGGAVVSEYYIPALEKLGCVDKAVIVDASASTVKALHARYTKVTVQQADFRTFLDELSRQNKFDAVVIALPNCLHEEASVRALSCGLHVLCEKPLAMTEKGALKLGELSRKTEKKLTVGMVRRLLPSSSALREVLKSNMIGSLKSVDIEYGDQYAWFSDNDSFFRRENGGVLADIGVHYLDLLGELAGLLRPISYHDDWKGGVEANCEFNLLADSNISVRLKLSNTHRLRNTAVFRGEQGEAIFEKDTFDRCLVRLWGSQNIKMELYPEKPFRGGNWQSTLQSCFAEELLEFFEAIQDKKPVRVTAWDAAKTISLIEWAYNHHTSDNQIHLITKEKEISKRPQLACAPAVVTGGTGFVGVHLVERLHELGFEQITVPIRNYQTCVSVARVPVTLPRVNLLDYQEVKKVVKGVRYVFHLAYGRDGTERHRARITIEGTQNVIEASIEAGVDSIVVLSSIYVFGHPETEEKIDETRPYAPIGGEYGQSKAKMEKWCLKRARSAKHTRIVVLNPSCVYGPWGKTYTLMPVQMAKDGTFCWIEGGYGVANYTFIDNLIDAILLAADCPQAHGERFIINDGATTWRAFLTPVLCSLADNLPSFTKDQLVALHRQIPHPNLFDVVRVITTDQRVMETLRQTVLFRKVLQIAEKWTPRLLQKARRLKNSSPTSTPSSTNHAIPPVWLADLFGPTTTVFSSEKARSVLNWVPRINLEQGQKLATPWLQSINVL